MKRNKKKAFVVIQPMGRTVQHDSVQSGIEQQDLQAVAGGRVALLDAADVLSQAFQYHSVSSCSATSKDRGK